MRQPRFLLPATCLIPLALAIIASAAATPRTPKFDRDIQPVLDRYCVTCHRSSGPMQGLSLERGVAYRMLLSVQSSQSGLRLVQPGKPDQSYLWRKVDGSFLSVGGTGYPMPFFPGNPIDPASKNLIREWIRNGAQQ